MDREGCRSRFRSVIKPTFRHGGLGWLGAPIIHRHAMRVGRFRNYRCAHRYYSVSNERCARCGAGRCGSAYSSGARPMTERDRRPRRTPDSSPSIGRCAPESACGIVTVALCLPMRVPRALAPDSQEFGHAEELAVTECKERELRPSLRRGEAPRRPVNRRAVRVSSVFTSTIQNRSRVPKGVWAMN